MTSIDIPARPFLKWAGGKRQLLPEIRRHMPGKFLRYYEPFLGGGAVLFDLRPDKAVVNDVNGEIANAYAVVRNDVSRLIAALKRHQNERGYYYRLRARDREKGYGRLSQVERAARTIFLNKTCYNGLFRVNRAGQFNVPFGAYKRPEIVNEAVLRAVSRYLNAADVEILNSDFEQSVRRAGGRDFVYLDPPYHPISRSASFTGYSAGGFGEADQIRLKKICDDLNKKGCKFLLSNSYCDFILDLYKGYRIVKIEAARSINAIGGGRGKIPELLVKNYV